MITAGFEEGSVAEYVHRFMGADTRFRSAHAVLTFQAMELLARWTVCIWLCSGRASKLEDTSGLDERYLELRCAHCSRRAVCIGRYEDSGPAEPACGECCGHGNEDGWCVMLDNHGEVFATITRLAKLVESDDAATATLVAERDALKHGLQMARAALVHEENELDLIVEAHAGYPADGDRVALAEVAAIAIHNVVVDIDKVLAGPRAERERTDGG